MRFWSPLSPLLRLTTLRQRLAKATVRLMSEIDAAIPKWPLFPRMIAHSRPPRFADLPARRWGGRVGRRAGRRPGDFLPAHPSTPIRDGESAVRPFRDRHLSARRRVATLPLDLQPASLVLHHPVLADHSLLLHSKDRIQFCFARPGAVGIGGASEASEANSYCGGEESCWREPLLTPTTRVECGARICGDNRTS